MFDDMRSVYIEQIVETPVSKVKHVNKHVGEHVVKRSVQRCRLTRPVSLMTVGRRQQTTPWLTQQQTTY